MSEDLKAINVPTTLDDGAGDKLVGLDCGSVSISHGKVEPGRTGSAHGPCSARWRLALLLFVVFMLLYLHSVNLSLAVVCMVNSPSQLSVDFVQSVSDKHLDGVNILTENITIGDTAHQLTNSVDTADTLNDKNKTVVNITDNGSDGYVTKTGQDRYIPQTSGLCSSIKIENRKEMTGELNWNKTDISLLLSCFFYGNFFTQIPAGRFADRYGGKHIITVSMTITAVLSLLTPVCARSSIYLMYAIRIVIGLALGTIVPVGISMLGSWAPPEERASMLALSGCGFFVGTIVSYLTSGLLCVYGFDNGWASIFYIHGGLTVLFVFIWWYDAYNNPSEHPRIDRHELAYIQTSITHKAKKPSKDIPWKRMLTCKALWASITAQFAFNYSFTTVLINLPLFMKDVLKFDVMENGLFSALPYVFNMISILVSAKVATLLSIKSSLGHLATRRLFTVINLIGFAVCLVVSGQMTCEFRHLAVVLLCLFCVFSGVSYGGWFANHTEYAGQYSGTVFGITNAGGIIAAILASMIAGMLTPNGIQAEWKVVFYIAAGIDLFGTIVYTTCSSVQLQPWAGNGVVDILVVSGSAKEKEALNPINEQNGVV